MATPAFNPKASFDLPSFDPKAGYDVAPAASSPQGDGKNVVQRTVDALTQVTPEQEAKTKAIPYVGGMLNQAQKFGAGAIQGATQPFVHPLDTLAGVGNTILHPVDTAKGMYRSAVANPAGFAGNVVGGAVTGEALAPAAQAAANVAGDVGKAAGSRALLLGKTPAEAYESALKPSTTLSQADRASIVQTGLQNKIPVSKSGLEDIGNLIDDYNNKIKAEIAQDPTRPIDPNAVATRADAAKARFANQVNAQPDLNAIEASRQQFLTEQGAQPGKPGTPPRPTGVLDAQGRPVMTQGTPATPPQPAPPMNAADAQAMKQGTYQVLKGKFGEQGSAAVEAQKALARGLKEEIATQFPEINNLNAAESRLLDLQPVLERAVNRTGNHQLVGIGTPIAGAAAKAVTGSGTVGVVAGTLKGILDNPMVKSRLAIALSKGAKIPIGQASARVQAYSAALGSAAAAEQASSGDQTTQ